MRRWSWVRGLGEGVASGTCGLEWLTRRACRWVFGCGESVLTSTCWLESLTRRACRWVLRHRESVLTSTCGHRHITRPVLTVIWVQASHFVVQIKQHQPYRRLARLPGKQFGPVAFESVVCQAYLCLLISFEIVIGEKGVYGCFEASMDGALAVAAFVSG
jgi:hypothetical protein